MRDVMRCSTVLQVLKTTACAGDDGDLQSSERASDEDYNLSSCGIGGIATRPTRDQTTGRKWERICGQPRVLILSVIFALASPRVSVWPRSCAPPNPTKRFVSSSPALLTSVVFLATL